MGFIQSLVLFFLPFYQLSQIPDSLLGVLPFRVYLYDLLLVALVVFCVFRGKINTKNLLFKPAIFFVSSLALSLFVAYSNGLYHDSTSVFTSLAYLFRLTLYCLLLFIQPKVKSLSPVYYLVLVLGLFQYLFLWRQITAQTCHYRQDKCHPDF